MKKYYTNLRSRFWIFLILFLLFNITVSKSQVPISKHQVDSLLNLFRTTTNDTTKLNCMNTLSWSQSSNDPKSAMKFAQQGLNLADSLLKKSINKPDLWLSGQVIVFHNIIGNIYNNLGNYPEALNQQIIALKISEKIQNKRGMLFAYGNIGGIYTDLGNYNEAIKNHKMALKYAIEMNDSIQMAYCFVNIGEIIFEQKKYKEALINFLDAIKIFEKNGNKFELATAYMDAGGVYVSLKNYSYGINYLLKSLKLYDEINSKEGKVSVYRNLGEIYKNIGDYKKAVNYQNMSLAISQEINSNEGVKASYKNLAELYFAMNDYKKAYEFHNLYSDIKDSLINTQSNKQIAEMSAKYDSEKKEQQIQLLNKEQEKQSAIAEIENRRKNIIIFSVACGLLFLLLFTIMVVRSLKISKKQNAIIAEKNQIVEHQKLSLEEHQKEIIDSIYYARRIQQALLPTEKYIENAFKRLRKSK